MHIKMRCNIYVKINRTICKSVRFFVRINTQDSDVKMRMYIQRNMRYDTYMPCLIMSFYFNTKFMFCLHLVTNRGSQGKPKPKIKLKCGKILMFQTFNQLVHYFLDTLVLPHFVRCTQVKIRMCWNNLFMLVWLVSKKLYSFSKCRL